MELKGKVFHIKDESRILNVIFFSQQEKRAKNLSHQQEDGKNVEFKSGKYS